jgi:hypothetical protein
MAPWCNYLLPYRAPQADNLIHAGEHRRVEFQEAAAGGRLGTYPAASLAGPYRPIAGRTFVHTRAVWRKRTSDAAVPEPEVQAREHLHHPTQRRRRLRLDLQESPPPDTQEGSLGTRSGRGR